MPLSSGKNFDEYEMESIFEYAVSVLIDSKNPTSMSDSFFISITASILTMLTEILFIFIIVRQITALREKRKIYVARDFLILQLREQMLKILKNSDAVKHQTNIDRLGRIIDSSEAIMPSESLLFAREIMEALEKKSNLLQIPENSLLLRELFSELLKSFQFSSRDERIHRWAFDGYITGRFGDSL